MNKIQLSHSSASKILSCEQKYDYYKVSKVAYDEDYELSDALSIGKAFHYIQEVTKHVRKPNISSILNDCQTSPDIQLKSEYRCLLHAMSLKYWRLHLKSEFTIAAIETSIKSHNTIGYIDAIMFGPDNKWWIVDLKANRTLNIAGLNSLPYDPQLNLYASFAKELAEEHNLVLDDFAGCRWRVVTKPSLKRRKEEDDLSYTKRLLASCKAYDIEVPLTSMNPKFFKHRHDQLHKIATILHSENADIPIRNYGNCMAYFSPCEYWSNCHGGILFSDTNLQVTEEK